MVETYFLIFGLALIVLFWYIGYRQFNYCCGSEMEELGICRHPDGYRQIHKKCNVCGREQKFYLD